MSRPPFARRVRGRRALTLAFAPRLIIQLSRGCQISLSCRPIRDPVYNAQADRNATGSSKRGTAQLYMYDTVGAEGMGAVYKAEDTLS